MQVSDISLWVASLENTDEGGVARCTRKRRGSDLAHLPSPPPDQYIYPDESTMPTSPKRRRVVESSEEWNVTPRPRQTALMLDGAEDLSPAATRSQPSGSASSVSRASSPSKQLRFIRTQPTGFNAVNLNNYNLPPTLETLVKDLKYIATGQGLLPESLQAEFQDTGEFFPMHFSKDASRERVSRTPPLEYAHRILENANYCNEYKHGEASWNMEVHARVLEWVLRIAPGGGGLLDYRYCVDAAISPEFKPQKAKSKMVDFCLPIKVNKDEKKVIDNLCRLRPEVSINHTDWGDLIVNPIAISIETKAESGNYSEALLQIGTWLSAQWRSLCYGGCDPHSIEFLPGIIVVGGQWSLVVCIRAADDGNATILEKLSIGTTDSLLGIYTLVACLHRLKEWAETIFWPAFQKHIIDE